MALMTHAERIIEVRFLLGDPSTTTISDSVIDRFLARQEEYYGTDLDNQCYVLYNTCLDCLIYLVNRGVSGSGGSIAGGELTKRREKMGSVEIEETYSSSSSSSNNDAVNTWSSLYDYFKKHPEFVCKSLKKSAVTSVIIGGVSVAEKDSIYSNSDSFGCGYAENQDARDMNISMWEQDSANPYNNYLPLS